MSDLATPKPSYRKVVAALEESEEHYRVLVEAVRRYAIFMLDPKGTIMTWNAGVRELLGYERDDIVGQSGALVFNATDRAVGAFKRELAQAKRLGEWISEHAAIHKDGTEAREAGAAGLARKPEKTSRARRAVIGGDGRSAEPFARVASSHAKRARTARCTSRTGGARAASRQLQLAALSATRA